MKALKVALFFEKFVGTANGVYTAMNECKKALNKHPAISVSMNETFKAADVIHAHSIGLAYIALALRHKNKLVVTAHVVPESFADSLVGSRLWMPIAKWYLKWAFSLAKEIIAVSPMVKDGLEALGVKTPITIIGNPVDLKSFKDDEILRKKYRNKYKIDDKAFLMLGVGQIQPRKGVIDFINIAKACPDIPFVWVGSRPYGKLTADIKTHDKAIQAAPKNVQFIGAVSLEDMPGIYNMADCLLFTSYQETFGFPIIEAAACNRPLLLRDLLDYKCNFKNAYIAARNIKTFTNEIKKLSREKAYYKTWQSKASRLAEQYNINTISKESISVYKRVSLSKKRL